MNVETIMTGTVVSVDPSTSIRDAIRLIEDSDIRHLPVVEGGKLVGILSDRDLREYRIPLLRELDEIDAERAQQLGALLDTPVREVMSAEVISVESREPVESVIDAMLDYKVGAVPVIDHFSEELVGIVSYVDVLRLARDLLTAGEDD